MGFDLTRHRFGANYVPSQGWYSIWNDFKPEVFAQDFAALAEIGLDHIRLQTIWPWFHPLPGLVSPAHLDRLESVMSLAAQSGLDVSVCVFTGWLSGHAFVPPFAKRGEAFFTNPQQIDYQKLYLQALAARLIRHPNFLGFDLGNEMNVVWGIENEAAADRWNSDFLALCHQLAPERLHVNGIDHQPYFWVSSFTPQGLAKTQPCMLNHVYSYWSGAQTRYPNDHKLVVHLPRYMARLARAYAGEPSKPVWLQEFGQSKSCWPDDDIPNLAEGMVRTAIEEGVSWFTWWASHDVDPSFGYHPFEYDLGLLDLHNNLKPVGETFKKLVAEFKGREVKFPTAKIEPPAIRDAEHVWQWMEQQAT